MTLSAWNRYLLAVAACALLVVSATAVFPEDAGGEEYVCPPCGHECLKTTFPEPGSCGVCGMELVPFSTVADRHGGGAHAQAENRKKVAILIFDGVEIIDYTGPWEIFGGAGFGVFTVAKTPDMITTVYGMKVTPDYTLEEHPAPDIVLVPGGQVFGPQSDPAVKSWLNDSAIKAEVVLSVCNGAFILAKAGLLKGLKATTTRPLVDGLAAAGEDITVVHDVRFVDNGKIITSGGLSAGMDAALHVAARYLGDDGARRLAKDLEYDWRAD